MIADANSPDAAARPRRATVAGRIWALMRKEAMQLLRDRATFGMLLGIPLLQIALFGCAIELSPLGLRVAIVAHDPQQLSQIEHLVTAQSAGVRIDHARSLPLALQQQKRGEAVLVIDADVRPRTVYLDATNPVLTTQAELLFGEALRAVSGPVTERDNAPPFLLKRLYDTDQGTQPYLVSGLLGVILTMSLVMMSALCVARERERGTLDCLLSMQVSACEVWIGKLSPYLVFGLIQAGLILGVARFGFQIHALGSLWLLGLATALFAMANLSLGFLFSCVARLQMQAMQLTFFFFLPSSLLTGFMFPFHAMPHWAQALAELLPLTHYLRIARGVLLRGADTPFVMGELLPIVAFATFFGLASNLLWSRLVNRSAPYAT